MNKKYPYRDAKAKIISILGQNEKSGHVVLYDSQKARYDLIQRKDRLRFNKPNEHEIYEQISNYADKIDGILKNDFWGESYVTKYSFWKEYDLVVQYKGYDSKIYSGIIKTASYMEPKIGDYIDVCYLTKDPYSVEVKSEQKTINDYYKNFMGNCILILLTIVTVIIFVYVIFIEC